MDLYNEILAMARMGMALALPMIPGLLALKLAFPELELGKLEAGLLALLAGHALFSSLAFLLTRLGLAWSFSSLSLILAGLSCFLYFLVLRFRGKPGSQAGRVCYIVGRAVFLFLALLAIIYFIMLGVVSVCDGVGDWPGVGVWGLKAKMIFHTGGCEAILSDPELAFSHPEYPLGYPLMIAWCAFFSGTFDSFFLKLLPVFWGGVLFLTIYIIGKNISGRRNASLLIALCLASTTNYVSICVKMYAEAMFIPFVLFGVYFLAFEPFRVSSTAGTANGDEETGAGAASNVERIAETSPSRYRLKSERLALGVCFLLFSCWYKMEGIVFLFSAVCMLAVFAARDVVKWYIFSQPRQLGSVLDSLRVSQSRPRRDSLNMYVKCLKREVCRSALSPILVFLLVLSLWLLTVVSYGVSSRDFSLAAIGDVDVNRVKAICGAFFRELAWNKYDAGVLASMSLVLVFAVAGWMRIKQFCRKSKLNECAGGGEIMSERVSDERWRGNEVGGNIEGETPWDHKRDASAALWRCACGVFFIAGLAATLFCFAFFTSDMPLWWHLQSVKRILLVPEILVTLTSLGIYFNILSDRKILWAMDRGK